MCDIVLTLIPSCFFSKLFKENNYKTDYVFDWNKVGPTRYLLSFFKNVPLFGREVTIDDFQLTPKREPRSDSGYADGQ